MQIKLRGDPKFTNFDHQRVTIMLLQAIKTMMHQFDHLIKPYMAMANAIGRFWTLYQGKNMHNITFFECFNTIVEPEEEDKVEEVSKEKFLAICFIKKACHARYNRLIEELHNEFLKEQDNYLKTVNKAYNMLNDYQDRSKLHGAGNLNNGALSFSTVGEEEEKKDEEGKGDVMDPKNGGCVRPEITCHDCRKKGHFANQCPDRETRGTTMLMVREEEGQDTHYGSANFQFTTICEVEEED
eukprot:6129310-Ditylum_brightwellii.AAC.1